MLCSVCGLRPPNRFYQVVSSSDGSVITPPTFLCAECIMPGQAPVQDASPVQDAKTTFFDRWVSENCIIGSGRSRFDWLRENLPLARNADEAESMIRAEDFLSRYPVIPYWDWTASS